MITEEIQKLVETTHVSGLITGMENTYRHVMLRAQGATFGTIDFLAELEPQWLSTPYDEERLREYEELLGIETLQRLIISDRHLGFGFVSGGRVPDSELRRLSAKSEFRNRYLLGLLDHLRDRLTQERPDIAFCYDVAGAPAYAIAMLCKHLEIPFLKLTHSRVGARQVLDPSPLALMTEVAEIFKGSKKDPSILAKRLSPVSYTHLRAHET